MATLTRQSDRFVGVYVIFEAKWHACWRNGAPIDFSLFLSVILAKHTNFLEPCGEQDGKPRRILVKKDLIMAEI